MKLEIRIITPDQLIVYSSMKEVILPTTTGEIGLLQGHTPLMTGLEKGVVRYKIDQDRGWIPIVVYGGIAKVKNDEVLVLTSQIEEIKKENYEEAKALFVQANEDYTSAVTLKEKLEASENLKIAVARLQAYQFLDSRD